MTEPPLSATANPVVNDMLEPTRLNIEQNVIPLGKPILSEDEQPESSHEEQMRLESSIRTALNQQTQVLYEQYAKEQHPNDSAKQKSLVEDMQEQYFQRYMSEMHQNQLIHQRQQLDQLIAIHNQAGDDPSWASKHLQSEAHKASELPEPHPCPLIPATLWTKKELSEFKREVLRSQPKCCIKISSLSTATIRVPTHPDASEIYWEFATDNYDLGFGLYFEWNLDPPNVISVTISESSDEEEDDDDEEELETAVSDEKTKVSSVSESEQRTGTNGSFADVERGRRQLDPRPPTDELIPIYRRDCHTEVYCGSHTYPGVGVYVFKFDNSFSLWRSKWLYYRISFTK